MFLSRNGWQNGIEAPIDSRFLQTGPLHSFMVEIKGDLVICFRYARFKIGRSNFRVG